jgi:hypothetical protein
MQFIEVFIKLILKTRLDLQFQKIILSKVFGQSENKLTDAIGQKHRVLHDVYFHVRAE